MKGLYAVGKGFVTYVSSVLYLAHLVAAGAAVDAARKALEGPR